MNKLLAFVLVVVMVLCLCACGNKNNSQNTEPASTESTAIATEHTSAASITEESTATEATSMDPALFIGEWESEYSYLEIREGGAGMYKMNEDEYNREFDLTWEVVDNQLVITIHYADMEHVSIFDMNEDCSCLTLIQNMLPVHVTSDEVYSKQ